ncbi:50S ribosomal protein L2 [Candidatus Woesearchaeota archaeon]|jgi:large subunit ribosomal protein L2|nr:50S ribosomal protein L2 [Candidatus Woesearchaeota archaeon]
MGKRLIQQARGKGGPTYRAPSFRYKGKAKHNKLVSDMIEGEVIDLISCRGHSAPLAQVHYSNGETCLLVAAEGIQVGQKIHSGPESEMQTGNTAQLMNIPEGTMVYNIEAVPGDGGKFVRASGTFAKVIGKLKDNIVVQLPSKKRKSFSPLCRASIGVVAGGGRPEKPFLKAGVKYYKMKARNKLWPKIRGAAQNAVDHPFGNKRTMRKSKAKPVGRNAPPGRKVGMIAPKKTGRKKRS